MTLNLREEEIKALEELAERKDLNKTVVIRQALRLYQLVAMGGKKLMIGDPPVGLDIIY